MNRNYSAIALCAATIFVLGGQASAQPLIASGDVSIAGQHTNWMTDCCGGDTGFGLDAYGRFMLPFGNGFSVQLDGAIETSNSWILEQSALIGGHLSWRDPSQFMIGVMGGLGVGTVDGGEDYQAFLLGVEGQLYLGDTTLFKQAGITWAYEGDPDSEPLDLIFIRKGVRHFFDDGWTVDGEVGFAWGTFDGCCSVSDVSIFNWGIGVEKQLQTQLPVSIFARYEGAIYTHADCSDSMTEHRIMGGIRIAFGAPDAKTQNRLGANTDLPRFPTFPAVDVLEYCDF